MEIIYEKHPVSQERKAELRQQGYKIVDAAFAPDDYVKPVAKHLKKDVETREAVNERHHGDDLDALSVDALHALAKERGVTVHHKAGAEKVREALRATQEA